MRFVVLAGILMVVTTTYGQMNTSLYAAHAQYMERSVDTRRFKHEDVMRTVKGLGKEFTVRQAGTSVEGRSIMTVSYGNGPIQVLMWSQMHGDETTATRAMLDIFNFLQANDSYNDLRKKMHMAVTWHFIPMLNPDGASRFTRRNSKGIDINRDALRLQSPEGRLLKRVRDSVKADWGFNLHDQGRGTSVLGKPATISLLAPPFNAERAVNESRGDAMQLTKYLHDQITRFIPGQIGAYPDDFEPRAFGDNIQKWGTRTILIESGGFKQDWEKQEIRRLNFVLLLTAVDAIASGAYEKVPVDSYFEIPKNGESRMQELILFNVDYDGVRRDIAFDRRETDSEDFRKYFVRSFVSDIGDLSTSPAYLTFDVSGFEVIPGKVYGTELETVSQLQGLDVDRLLREGYTDVVVKQDVDAFGSSYKINVHKQAPSAVQEIRMGGNPSLLFRKNGTVKYALINGSMYPLE